MTAMAGGPLGFFSDEDLVDEIERRRLGGTGSEHVIEINDDSWSVRHPFRCRIQNEHLGDCQVTKGLERGLAGEMRHERGVGSFSVYPADLDQMFPE